MSEINYIGEHTLIGQVGHWLILLGFVACLFSTFSYIKATKSEGGWLKLGRLGFYTQGLATFTVIGIIFFMLYNHYFEYFYIWKHSNMSMELKYIFSCFWEGQQGSFLLWMFWQVVLGFFMMRKAGQWETRTMAVFGVAQAFLFSMLLGVYVGDGHQIGKSPFLLVREMPENISAYWTKLPDYLQFISAFADGNGLNPLLKNYWMTIHPPTLFLGFAATLIPFCYAIAGLWKKDFTGWVTPAIPWSFLGVATLGTGILMGGAWAYEALSFGGFWAWDPVENASLMPWLTLTAGGHLLLITKHRKRGMYASLFLMLSSFILTVYSTFLTRSGILGDSSVHSFTGDGMLSQLLLYQAFFTLGALLFLIQTKRDRWILMGATGILVLVALFLDWHLTLMGSLTLGGLVTFIFVGVLFWLLIRNISHIQQEEVISDFWTRETWMFIGSLVLAVSAIVVIGLTSVPVFNEMFGSSNSIPVEWYNPFMIGFGIGIGLFMGLAQLLRYKKTVLSNISKGMYNILLFSTGISLVLIVSFNFAEEVFDIFLALLLFSSVFTIVGNGHYWLLFLKGKLNQAGASIAHIGVGFLLLGTVISMAKNTTISKNNNGLNLANVHEDFNNNENIQLYKGDTVLMGNYYVSYREKSKREGNMDYRINYIEALPKTYQQGDEVKLGSEVLRATQAHEASLSFKQDFEAQYWEVVTSPDNDNYYGVKRWSAFEPGDSLFSLTPYIQLNEKFGNVAEPSTKHFWNHDVFTALQWADLEISGPEDDAWLPPQEVELTKPQDTLLKANCQIITSMPYQYTKAEKDTMGIDSTDIVIRYDLWVTDLTDPRRKTYHAAPHWLTVHGRPVIQPAYLEKLGLELSIQGLRNLKPKLVIREKEYVVMSATIFPYINILWLGCILMGLGTLMAVFYRFKQKRRVYS